MKRTAFVNSLSKELATHGWQLLEGKSAGAVAVFFRPSKQLVFLFGLQASSLYSEAFTGSFYLSRSFHWAYVVPGFPRRAYERVGYFLTPSERSRLNPQSREPSSVEDMWWHGYTSEHVDSLVNSVELAIPRFLSQKDLEKNVWGCAELRRHVELIGQITVLKDTLNVKPRHCKNQPKTEAAGVTANWYWAAEVVLSNVEPELLHRRYVELLAVDSWRYSKYWPEPVGPENVISAVDG